MSIISEQAVFLQDVARLLPYCASIGFIVTLGEGYRTPEHQLEYFKKKLSKTKIGQHTKRLAIDFNFFRMEENKIVPVTDAKRLSDIGKFWKSLDPKNDCGILWGWDTYHFERKSA
jgi:hypothetical protein